MTDQPPVKADDAKGVLAPWWWPSMRDILALASTAILAAAFLIPMFRPDAKLDPDLKGGILLQWGLVMGYYFGTSKSSGAKDQTISDMAAKQ